jgi:hypothetical protein
MKMETYGLDLNKILEEAKEHKNEKLVKVMEEELAKENNEENIQALYNAFAQKWTATGGKELWNVDAEYVQSLLK